METLSRSFMMVVTMMVIIIVAKLKIIVIKHARLP